MKRGDWRTWQRLTKPQRAALAMVCREHDREVRSWCEECQLAARIGRLFLRATKAAAVAK